MAFGSDSSSPADHHPRGLTGRRAWLGRLNFSSCIGLAAIAGLLLNTVFLIRHASYAVGGADASGYARIARSLLNGPIMLPVTELGQFNLPDEMLQDFIPIGYAPVMGTSAMTPFYPVGFPLHLALGALIAGWDYGPYLVCPIAAILSLILIYLLGLELGLSREYSIAAAVILGGNPTFILMALWPMSDIVALCWALTAVWSSLRSGKSEGWALLAGAAFGMAFLVRPINLLLLIPILLCLRLKPKTFLFFMIGGSPLAAIFFCYNTASYGHPFQTGYTVIGLYNEITSTGFTARFQHYVYWLMMTMSPLLPLGWIGVAADRIVHWRVRAMLIAWFGTLLFFYCCYTHYNFWWYTRFLLPGYPAVVLGALLTTRDLMGWLRKSTNGRYQAWQRRIALALLLAVVFSFERHYVRLFYVAKTGEVESVNYTSCRLVEQLVPRQALVVSMEMSGALKFYTDRHIVRWDVIAPNQWQLLKDRARERNYQFYALLMQQELDEAQKRVPGKWIQLGTVRHISLWKIEPAG